MDPSTRQAWEMKRANRSKHGRSELLAVQQLQWLLELDRQLEANAETSALPLQRVSCQPVDGDGQALGRSAVGILQRLHRTGLELLVADPVDGTRVRLELLQGRIEVLGQVCRQTSTTASQPGTRLEIEFIDSLDRYLG